MNDKLNIEIGKVGELSKEDLLGITKAQFDNCSPELQQALQAHGGELFGSTRKDLKEAIPTESPVEPAEELGKPANEPVEKPAGGEQPEQLGKPKELNKVDRDALKDKLEKINEQGVPTLTDDEILAIDDEILNTVSDDKIRKAILDRQKVISEREFVEKGGEAAGKFYEGYSDDDRAKLKLPKIEGVDDKNKPSEISVINDFEALTGRIDSQLANLPGPVADTIREHLAIQRAIIEGQNVLDNKLQKENTAALNVEKRKKMQKDVLNVMRFVKWAAIGAGAGYLISLAPDALGWGVGVGAGVFLGGVGYEGLLSIKGKELMLDRAKLDRSIQERRLFYTQLRERALKREVKALSAFTSIAAQVYADSAAITDEGMRKKYIGGFTSKLGLSTLNAILTTK